MGLRTVVDRVRVEGKILTMTKQPNIFAGREANIMPSIPICCIRVRVIVKVRVRDRGNEHNILYAHLLGLGITYGVVLCWGWGCRRV